jgi:ZIP family zinc transporter
MDVLFAFLLTLIAGLSTGIGSIIALFSKSANKKFLSLSLGFSAGVMIYVSLVEIFSKAKGSLVTDFGGKLGLLYTILGFFGGIVLIAVIDRLIPDDRNPHIIADDCASSPQKNRLLRTGLFTALAIGIHNFPEGLATFVGALQTPSIAIPIVIAVAIHNIPEGLAVSAPIFFATASRKKAFCWSFLSGLAEPVGAVIGYLFLMPIMNNTVFGVLFAMVAGIMIFISLDELLPSAHAYGKHRFSIYGLIAGMAVMAVSLWLFI